MIHPPPANPGLRKAAILLVVLGEDAASAIYRQLPAVEVERITREIADLRSVDPETALSVLEEFDRLVLTGDYLAQGGRDYANKLLVKAFGEDGAQDLLRQVSHAAEASASRLGSLRKADRRSEAGAFHPQPDVHLRGPAYHTGGWDPRTAGADGQEDSGHRFAWRF